MNLAPYYHFIRKLGITLKQIGLGGKNDDMGVSKKYLSVSISLRKCKQLGKLREQ